MAQGQTQTGKNSADQRQDAVTRADVDQAVQTAVQQALEGEQQRREQAVRDALDAEQENGSEQEDGSATAPHVVLAVGISYREPTANGPVDRSALRGQLANLTETEAQRLGSAVRVAEEVEIEAILDRDRAIAAALSQAAAGPADNPYGGLALADPAEHAAQVRAQQAQAAPAA